MAECHAVHCFLFSSECNIAVLIAELCPGNWAVIENSLYFSLLFIPLNTLELVNLEAALKPQASS